MIIYDVARVMVMLAEVSYNVAFSTKPIAYNHALRHITTYNHVRMLKQEDYLWVCNSLL